MKTLKLLFGFIGLYVKLTLTFGVVALVAMSILFPETTQKVVELVQSVVPLK
jgi:hypothetical protein